MLQPKIIFPIVLICVLHTHAAYTFTTKDDAASFLSNSSYDVVVAGAGTSGVAAAIQAARMGVNAALLEQTDWVGGQATSAGVSTMDQAGLIHASGIYGEFISRIKQHYYTIGLSISTCYYSDSSWRFEPRVGRQVFLDMLGGQTRGFINSDTVACRTATPPRIRRRVFDSLVNNGCAFRAFRRVRAPDGDARKMRRVWSRLRGAQMVLPTFIGWSSVSSMQTKSVFINRWISRNSHPLTARPLGPSLSARSTQVRQISIRLCI